MWGSMVDIQSAEAEIRRGKKEERKKNKRQDENIMVCPIPYGDHYEQWNLVSKMTSGTSQAVQRILYQDNWTTAEMRRSFTWTSLRTESWEDETIPRGCSAVEFQSAAACSSACTDSEHGKTARWKPHRIKTWPRWKILSRLTIN